jgi:rRNA maturation endonuclease Nob1
MALIKFVQNHSDLSTDRGFQFEFQCDRCGTGFQTTFQASATGIMSEVLDTASGFLGGIFGNAADVGRRMHSVAWERAHDKAFAKAVEEVRPSFAQCPKCVQWVCREACWNESRGLCKECAPDLGVEQAVAESEVDVEEVRAAARTSKSRSTVASCPSCGASVSKGGKFCPDCGAALSAEKHCTDCGTKMPAAAKFCPDCGAKQE